MTTPTLIELPELEQGDIDRFYRYVKMADPESCWEWQSTRNNSGYGKFWLHGRTDLAHRVSYRIANGPIPNGHQIRHMCDNPTCVNPRHLLTGTGKQNARDAMLSSSPVMVAPSRVFVLRSRVPLGACHCLIQCLIRLRCQISESTAARNLTAASAATDSRPGSPER